MRNYNAKIRRKIIILFYGCALLFFLLSARVVCVQGIESAYFKKLASDQHVGREELPAIRGRILDRNGNCLAESIELFSVAANPAEVEDKKEAAKFISEAMRADYKTIFDKLSSGTTFVWIERKAENDKVEKIRNNKIKGIFVIRESSGKRFYTQGRLASHILGYTGIDDQGLDGIESIYDDQLKGACGSLESETDNFGRIIPHGKIKIKPAVIGNNITLTINSNIQFSAERELANAMSKYSAKRGTVIVMDVNTGEILALVNKPDFKPQFYYDYPRSNLRNSAISDSFEPGSVFKVFLAAAALDSGIVNISEKFYCGNSITVGGYQINNANDGMSSGSGRENIKEIITFSYNVGTTSISQKIGKDIYYKYIKAFGFGGLSGIDLSGEGEGIVWDKNNWSPSSLATMSFGQGISVTPIQMITALSAVANGGKLLRPYVVKSVTDGSGKIVKENQPQTIRRVISFKTSLQLAQILRNAVENGTGKNAKIPGYLVCGKTGTAQMAEGGGYSASKYVASFMGFFPAEEPRIAIIVKVEEPQGAIWGGVVSAPIFSEIGKAALWELGIPPSRPLEGENIKR